MRPSHPLRTLPALILAVLLPGIARAGDPPPAEPPAAPGEPAPAAEPAVEPAHAETTAVAPVAVPVVAEAAPVEASAAATLDTAVERPTSVIEDDVSPSLVVYERDGVSLAIGGLLQLHLAPYAGADSLLADDDPAQRAGFRMRRARIGFDATLPGDLGFLLVVNALESDPDVGTISEARLSWAPRTWLRLSAGADKVPFSHGELVSSADLSTIERPLTVQTLVPQNRLGAEVDGALLDDTVWYVAGVMNATEGYEQGNQFSGLLYVGRLEYRMGHAGGSGFGFSVGAGGYFENGPATNVVAGSADLQAWFGRYSLLAEGICDQITPDDSPMTSPEVADKVKRCGGYVEGQVPLWRHQLQAVVRGELVDDNTDIDDAGDAWLLSAGVNARPRAHLRVQLHYLGRYERSSAERANDAVILALQGEF